MNCDRLRVNRSVAGIRFATSLVMLDLDQRAPRTLRLPHQPLGRLAQLAASIAVHATVLSLAASIEITSTPGRDVRQADRSTTQQRLDVQHIVFLAPRQQPAGSGGGGGGNRQPKPIRRAQGVGTDAITLRVQSRSAAPVTTPAAPPVADVPPIPSIVLDAKPLASGLFDQIGLPDAGVMSGTSTGPGSGGGVGSGTGTGIGSGTGPGLGPGTGGGTGGGIYRAGGAVSAPRLIKEVKPGYTSEALRNRIQGTVVLDAVVMADGCASQIRVVRSLDPGLDEEAVAAVAQWRFEPGRLGGTPVNVLVRVMLDFVLR
jgi:TonB family protein